MSRLRGRAEITVREEWLLRALEPEVLYPPMTSRVKLGIDKDNGKIIIEAEDLRALRAAINSFLYWIYSAVGSVEKVERS